MRRDDPRLLPGLLNVFRQIRPYWCGPAAIVALQLELGTGPQLTQAQWACIADTSSAGTSEVGIKRCLRLLGTFYVSRRVRRPFGLAIVFDPWRNHWVAARCVDGCVLMLDPWDGRVGCFPWEWFRRVYFEAPRSPYALIVAG